MLTIPVRQNAQIQVGCFCSHASPARGLSPFAFPGAPRCLGCDQALKSASDLASFCCSAIALVSNARVSQPCALSVWLFHRTSNWKVKQCRLEPLRGRAGIGVFHPPFSLWRPPPCQSAAVHTQSPREGPFLDQSADFNSVRRGDSWLPSSPGLAAPVSCSRLRFRFRFFQVRLTPIPPSSSRRALPMRFASAVTRFPTSTVSQPA